MALIPKSTSVNVIMNRVAAEVGIAPVTDPFGSADPYFQQLKYLLNTAGEEIAIQHPWEFQNKEHQILTVDTDSGKYPLPDDFNYMIDQTGWERAENVPLYGPLSAQDWQYLLGRDLVSYTIYASFRINEGQFWIFPQPPPNDLDINFEYQSVNWVQDAMNANIKRDEVLVGTDIVMYDRTLITRYLKTKSLLSKGYDATAAQDDYNQTFMFLTGKDKGAEVLTAGRNGRGFPYLDIYNNTPDTNYGG